MPSSKRPPAPPPLPEKKGWGRRVLPIAALLALGVMVLAWYRESGRAQAPLPLQPLAQASARTISAGAGAAAAVLAPARSRQELVQAWQLADHTLCSYREASKYPAGSRPMAQNPDQVYPNAPVTEANPMRLDGGGTDSKVLLQTSQSRVHMASGESVAFSIRAVDADGKALPLVVTGATAAGIVYGANRASAQVVVPFADDGAGADPVAGDGAFAGVLAPAQTGLAGFNGTIRTQVAYSVAGKNGKIMFDVIYSPELPAVWSGQVREARENGSLNFYLKADVRIAGRYIVTGRVEDAKGQPFALLTFNDVLPAGPGEVRLSTFGKLLRDGAPVLPLTLRDVDGYLLRENTDPDRALMPRLEGKVQTSKSYPLSGFSDAEWQGEERERYLTEFGKDARLAREALLRNNPGAAVPASECASDAMR